MTDKFKIAVMALRNILEPIKYLQYEAEKDGAKLDGYMAIQLIQNASIYQEIARKALEAIDTVVAEVDSLINIENTDCVLFGKCGFAISNYPGCWEDCKHFNIKQLEKPLTTDEKTVCPECLKKCTNEELNVFGGLCEECSTDFN